MVEIWRIRLPTSAPAGLMKPVLECPGGNGTRETRPSKNWPSCNQPLSTCPLAVPKRDNHPATSAPVSRNEAADQGNRTLERPDSSPDLSRWTLESKIETLERPQRTPDLSRRAPESRNETPDPPRETLETQTAPPDPQVKVPAGQFGTLERFWRAKRLFDCLTGAFDRTLLDSDSPPAAFDRALPVFDLRVRAFECPAGGIDSAKGQFGRKIPAFECPTGLFDSAPGEVGRRAGMFWTRTDNGSRRREEADSRAGGARHPPRYLGGYLDTLRERRRRGIVVARRFGGCSQAPSERHSNVTMPLLTELWEDCGHVILQRCRAYGAGGHVRPARAEPQRRWFSDAPTGQWHSAQRSRGTSYPGSTEQNDPQPQRGLQHRWINGAWIKSVPFPGLRQRDFSGISRA